eukprot:TRINITY_DN2229_c0_g1_i1.p1 TRINITY_DN2229_c0_g1~~TRINITY_DN2229_c0_g1_i1.p1  ORF type:complete len:900 (-),score=272.79 TRINITY_DN2229_c0_g1_i1:60-2759(-)
MRYLNIKGLDDAAVKASREKNGSNDLPEPEGESFFDKLKENFEDPLIRILLVALLITLALAALGYADWVEGIGIGIAVFLATFVSTYSEYKNETSFRDLQQEASKVKNNVFRNGTLQPIFVADIVVGDLVLLQTGDKVPADGKLLEGNLMINQSALTGENDAVQKMFAPAKYVPTEKTNLSDTYLVFRGTVVDEGEAILRVEEVGKNTVHGTLYTELAVAEERDSPLKVKLSNLADGVALFGYIGASAIAISFLFKQFVIDQGYKMDAILTYVSLDNWSTVLHDIVTSVILAIIVIVVAVPEGLPMMIAIVLSLNMRKLLKSNVLVRKLVGIETAGSINILFVDKTGTLTIGEFKPVAFVSGSAKSYDSFLSMPKALKNVLAFCLRESTSSVVEESGPVGGNASDRAILAFLDKETMLAKEDVSHEKEILFNSERKFSAVQLKVHKNQLSFHPGEHITIVKGAPEILFSKCKTTYGEDGRLAPFNVDAATEKIDQLSRDGGIRVIAIATAETPLESDAKVLPNNLSLVGIVGIADEIRKESRPSIELANAAGIQVVMITGDRKETAVSVATELGLLKDKRAVLTSDQLNQLSDEQLTKIIPTIGVIARALPTDKSRLVRLSQAMGSIVGMTGDGVNDSAALKIADVGFAMGGGSEVAKEAADIVILNDNFESITKAVLYGRTIFKSIRKFIVFQSTVNAASFMIVFMGPFLGFDFPLTLIQLLWVNLVMDTLAALAFGGEPALKTTMTEKPIKRDAAIISPQMWSAILVNGTFIATLCIIALTSKQVRGLFVRDGIPSEPVFLTAFFAFFIFLTNFNSFNARTPNINVMHHVTENMGFVQVVALIFIVQVVFTYIGGPVLRTVALTLPEWLMIIGASSVIIPFDMLRKIAISSFLPPQK